MTNTEQDQLRVARLEAQKRWSVWGGWARWDKVFNHALQKWVSWAVVGIREDDPPRGAGSRVLARGKTFEEAFSNAEVMLEKRASRKPSPKKVNPRALPQNELPL